MLSACYSALALIAQPCLAQFDSTIFIEKNLDLGGQAKLRAVSLRGDR